MRALRLLLIATMMSALGGCVISREPLFPAASAIAAFGTGGRYATYDRTQSGTYKRNEGTVEIRPTASGYDFIDEKATITPFTLHRLDRSTLVAQAKNEDGYLYVVLRQQGNAVFVHAPTCDKQSHHKLAVLGIASYQGDCVLDKVDDVKAAFAALDFGQPTAKMVRE